MKYWRTTTGQVLWQRGYVSSHALLVIPAPMDRPPCRVDMQDRVGGGYGVIFLQARVPGAPSRVPETPALRSPVSTVVYDTRRRVWGARAAVGAAVGGLGVLGVIVLRALGGRSRTLRRCIATPARERIEHIHTATAVIHAAGGGEADAAGAALVERHGVNV